MIRKNVILAVGILFGVFGYAQNTVTGTVTDKNESPLPGVTVIVAGTTVGAQTDFDGKYTISAAQGAQLEFSYIGMSTQTVEVTSNVIDVQLAEDASKLDEVVLTALGLEKKKDEDMSSSTNIDSDAVKTSGETGVLQGLTGKTSGVLITRNNGDPGAGAYIQIRGQSTVLGNSSPLIILDGIPISNDTNGNFYQGGSQSLGGEGTDGTSQQSRLNDINPEDIESITVLKGAAAATIYGTGAANGVLVVNTKSGRKGAKGMKINFKQAVSVDQIFREFEKQTTYGQGSGGTYAWNNFASWGDKISSRSGAANGVANAATDDYFQAENGTKYYTITAKNDNKTYNKENRDQVFRNGFTSTTNLSISNNGERSSSFFSVGYLKQEGIIKGQSNYNRINLKYNNTTKYNDLLTVRLNTTYSNITSKRVQQGSNLSGLYLGYLRTPSDFNNTDYKGQYYANSTAVPREGAHRSYRNGIGANGTVYNNPGWTINEQTNPSDVDRFIINPELQFKFTDNQQLVVRYGLDYTKDTRHTFFPVNSAGTGAGELYRVNYNDMINNVNAFLNSNYKIGEDININTIIGTQFKSQYNDVIGGQSLIFSKQQVGDVKNFGNATAANELPIHNVTRTRKSGAYMTASADYKEELFLGFGVRYELPSTVAEPVVYPSINGGWVFTKNLLKDNPIVNFGKIRGSYGEIGIEPIAYINRTQFVGADISSSWGDQFLASAYGNPYQQSFRKGNPDLTIETKKQYEVGIDLRFLDNKLSLGATYYSDTTYDGILRLNTAASTGFTQVYKNAATISNKGYEIDVNYQLLDIKDFSLNISANVSSNKNMVESLSGVKRVTLNGFSSVSSSIVEGHAYGALWGNAFKRKADGSLEVDANGFPVTDTEAKVLGDPNPDWRGGMRLTASYKGFSLAAMFDTSQGADIWTGTEGVMKFFGIHPETANESTATTDLRTSSGAIIPAGTTFRGNIKNFGGGDVALTQSWYQGNGGGFGAVSEEFVKDASWTRFRELTLGYEFPKSLVSKLKLSKMSLSLTARNLYLWTNIKYIDPEINLSGASKGRGLDYFTNPSTSSYLATLTLSL